MPGVHESEVIARLSKELLPDQVDAFRYAAHNSNAFRHAWDMLRFVPTMPLPQVLYALAERLQQLNAHLIEELLRARLPTVVEVVPQQQQELVDLEAPPAVIRRRLRQLEDDADAV